MNTQEPKKPRKRRTEVTELRRKQIAVGRAQGQSAQVIARQTGLGVGTVHNLSRDPRTVTMILSLKEQYRSDFEEIFKDSVAGIKRDVKAKNREVAYNARNQALKYITAGDPPLYRVGDQGTTDGDFTLEELMITLRRVQANAG